MSNNAQLSVGLVIPTSNAEKHLKKNLKVIDQEQNKVLVIDSNSSDRTVEIAKEYKCKISTENNGIVFLDEIDKISGRTDRVGGDVSREGVQRDLLPIVEGTSVTTKYGVIKTDHILFVAAGAFHLSKPSDLIPELQGRFPIRVELDNLTQEDFLKILCEPKNSLTKQYKALIKAENVEIIFNDDALKEISNKAFIINSEIENIGARRLHTVMSKLLNEILFDIPEKIGPNAKVVITKKMVEDKLNSITQNKDLSEYIL